MSQHVRVLTTQNWDQEVLGSAIPVLVDFWAEWCAPCRRIAPLIETLAETYAGRAVMGKLNVDEHPELAGRYSIRSIPTLLLFRSGQLLDQRVGALPFDQMKSILDEHIAQAVAGGTSGR